MSVEAPTKSEVIWEYISKLDEILSDLDEIIEKKRKNKNTIQGINSLLKLRKKLRKVRGQTERVIKVSRTRNGKNSNNHEFSKKYKVSRELYEFLGLEGEEMLSRIDICRAICVYVNHEEEEKREEMLKWRHLNPLFRNLQNPQNKKVIIPDERLSRLLRYDEYVERVKRGEITIRKKDKLTGEVFYERVEDPGLYYSTVQRLITPHIIR